MIIICVTIIWFVFESNTNGGLLTSEQTTLVWISDRVGVECNEIAKDTETNVETPIYYKRSNL